MYDKISSKYGWDDEQIGDLTVARFAQINAAIDIASFAEQRAEQARQANALATMARYIVQGYMAEVEHKQPLLDEIPLAVAFDDIDRAVAVERADWRAKHGNQVSGGGPIPGRIAEPNAGSHERMMRRFGGAVQGNGWGDLTADIEKIRAKNNEDRESLGLAVTHG